MPGWTTVQMLNTLGDPTRGLRWANRNVKDPSLSFVVLLAGTKDMGHRCTVDEITQNLLQLHQICYQEGVPSTIAIGIPPSGYQSYNLRLRRH